MHLPPPWRRFFESFTEISSDSAAYNLISEAYGERLTTALPAENMEEWAADQDLATAQFQFPENRVLSAKYEILGTYDGQTFRWADANHSINKTLSKRAKVFRDTYRDCLGFLVSLDEFPVSIRDIESLQALAGRDEAIERTFLAEAYDGRAMAMTLRDLEYTDKAPKKSILGRIFNTDESIDFKSWMQELLTGRLAVLQPNDENLERIENILSEASKTYEQGDWNAVMALLDKAKTHMGEHPADTMPAGWLYLCEGWTQLHLKRTNKARDAFNIARRAMSVPDYSSALLGKARSCDDPRATTSFLLAGYIFKPDWTLKHLAEDELANVKTMIAQQENSRPDESLGPEALLKSALAEMCALEVDAMQRSNAASQHREQSHVMCEKDFVASRETAWQWRLFVLKWMTPGRHPNIGSYSSDPDYGTEKLKSFSINIEGDSALAEATYEAHGLEQKYEYYLKQTPLPLSENTLWRIDEVLSVWDHEKIKLH